MSQRPTLERQLAEAHDRPLRQPRPTPGQTMMTTINGILTMVLLLLMVALLASLLGLALLVRAVF